MRWLALPVGIVLLVVTLLDVFRTMVIPRAFRGRYRLTRLIFLAVWRPWRWVGLRAKTQESREHILAGAAPMGLFVLLGAWAALTTLGYGLMLWSAPFVHGVHGPGDGSFFTALYFSGTSLFTIGFGDVLATGLSRAVVIVEGATGLGLVAVVIGYLPVLYQAFNRREVGVLLLDARAGSPPSGPELLRRTAGSGGFAQLPDLFDYWERWAADILETHLSYPLLVYFRSPHDSTSWVTSLGAVLDAATLVLAVKEATPLHSAQMFHSTGVHAVEDLFFYFRLTERQPVIEREEFDQVLEDLRAIGFHLRPADDAWERFLKLRAKYAGRLNALAIMVAAPPAQWIGDRSTLPLQPELQRQPRH
ncbi:MAG: potassium channel family protein [Actinomycetota bacterium]|nr:potassium channel family protein [Actinomycetota bacterium]